MPVTLTPVGVQRGNPLTSKSNWQNICGLKCLDVFASPIDMDEKHYNQKIWVVTSRDFNGQNHTANLNITFIFFLTWSNFKLKYTVLLKQTNKKPLLGLMTR